MMQNGMVRRGFFRGRLRVCRISFRKYDDGVAMCGVEQVDE